jgi:hypothetical protein
MRSILTALIALISLGSAVIAHAADVTNISNQQKTMTVGNGVTVVDRKTTVINNGKTFTKSRSSTSGLKLRTR